MFKYWESYNIDYAKVFNDNELRDYANEYKSYLLTYNLNDNLDNFNDFIIYCYFFTIECESCEFCDSNIEEFYNEIKKYM